MEPGSPPTMLHSDSLTVDIKGPFELPVLLPKIVSVTTLSSSSDTSSGKNSLVSDEGVSVGPTTGSSEKKSGSNGSTYCVCDVCSCYFLNEDKAQRHRLRHEGKKAHFCFVCGRGFHYLNKMRQHEQTHGCVKAHTCLVCGQKFLEECELVEHQIMHMSAEMYTCRMCESKFCTREALEKHEQVHASGADMCVCGECGMTFEQTAALERHLKLHVTETPHRCHLCSARFSEQRSLEKHMVMHVATKREQCPVCRKTYCGHGNLMSHIRVKHCRVYTTVANGNDSGKVLCDPPITSPPDNASAIEKGPPGAACGGTFCTNSNVQLSTKLFELYTQGTFTHAYIQAPNATITFDYLFIARMLEYIYVFRHMVSNFVEQWSQCSSAAPKVAGLILAMPNAIYTPPPHRSLDNFHQILWWHLLTRTLPSPYFLSHIYQGAYTLSCAQCTHPLATLTHILLECLADPSPRGAEPLTT